MGNILKNELDCTCEEFLASVYGGRSRPCTSAMKTLFSSILMRSSTIVKELSVPLRACNSRIEAKRAQEMVSRWLMNYDFDGKLNQYLLGRAAQAADERTTFAIDFSDISKEFGGNGMEGMELGYDGSRGCTAMGHDFISVSIVGAEHLEAEPVYVKLGEGRHKKDGLLHNAITALMGATGGRGWMVLDRGMDDAKFIFRMKNDARHAVVRIKDMKRDVFGNGKAIDATLSGLPFRKAHLNTYRGVRKVELRCAKGVMQYCADPHSKDAPAHETGLLVVESRFDGKSIYLYVVCPDESIDDQDCAWEFAVRAAQAYCDRWQIETSFQSVKQEFRLEDARVRKFKRLVNIFDLCFLSYVFMIRYLRNSRHFKKIVKVFSDNFKTLTARMHSLLAGLRELYDAQTLRNMTGRPRKSQAGSPAQMLFRLE